MNYKWKKVQKGVFYDKYKQKDVVKYREIFFGKMKKLLPYFVKFSKNGSILSKKYPENCVIRKPNWQPIIMIIYNKSSFLPNDRC